MAALFRALVKYERWDEIPKPGAIPWRGLPSDPAPERPYTLDVNAALGPLDGEPYAAPKLDAVNVERKHVRLEDYRGQSVILVFYLNDECVHCPEQLVSMSGKAADWATERTRGASPPTTTSKSWSCTPRSSSTQRAASTGSARAAIRSSTWISS